MPNGQIEVLCWVDAAYCIFQFVEEGVLGCCVRDRDQALLFIFYASLSGTEELPRIIVVILISLISIVFVFKSLGTDQEILLLVFVFILAVCLVIISTKWLEFVDILPDLVFDGVEICISLFSSGRICWR